MIRLGLLGSGGRMGDWVTRLVASEFSNSASIAATARKGDALAPLLATDAVIDFSAPAAMLALAEEAARTQGPLPAFVVGSTGWKLDERRALEALAARTPVLMASNFSTGVLAVQEILKQAAPILDKLGYKPVIVETHHKHKKDSPSGTALSLQRAISPAGPGNVQTLSIRAGEIIGDHAVTFYGPGDTIRIEHHAMDRSIFARGAIQVALWLAGKRGQASGSLIGIETYFKETLCSS